MKLYYHRMMRGLKNFGDELNPWLWQKLIPGLLDEDPQTLFLGIGTLLNEGVPQAENKIIFGSGAGYGNPPRIDSSWKIYCLRGPLSARALGVSEDHAVTDAALLAMNFVQPSVRRKYPFSYMPHALHASLGGGAWQSVCLRLGIHYVDPQKPVEEVLESIRYSECLITEAMHGAVVADALRVRWIPVKTTNEILAFKWHDWCRSMGLDYAPESLLPLWNHSAVKQRLVALQLKRIMRFSKRRLSHPKILNHRLETLRRRLDHFQKDIQTETVVTC